MISNHPTHTKEIDIPEAGLIQTRQDPEESSSLSGRKVLDNAKSSLSLHGLALAKNRPRWKSLDVRLFLGPVQTENETLDDYDAFVATEV